MTTPVPSPMSAADEAEFHRWKNQQAVQSIVREQTERTICDVWDIQWAPDGRHWNDFRSLRDDVRELRRRLRDSEERGDVIRKTIWERLITGLVGAGVALLSWMLARRTGVTLPGASP